MEESKHIRGGGVLRNLLYCRALKVSRVRSRRHKEMGIHGKTISKWYISKFAW